MAGYIGTTPVPQATQHRESFTATGGQTSFATAGYTPQFIDVYLNGVKLAPADYTATNGSDVVLASGATASDILEIVAYTPFEVANQTFTGTTTAANLTVTGAFTSQGIDDNADAVAITIDSSENVGIGTSSPSSFWSGGNQLVVGSGTGSQGLTIYSGTTSDAGIYFSDGTVGNALYQGQIFYRHNDDAMVFNTAVTERMRIDSSGNLLVGTTDSGPSTAGIKLFNGNYARFVRATASGPAVFINGLTDDGELLRFQKDGSTVGSIGTLTGSGVALQIKGEVNAQPADIVVKNSGGSAITYRFHDSLGFYGPDATQNLGRSTARWKDLYLSGGVYLGGTGSANKLDDYEEGTADLTFSGSTSGSTTYTYNATVHGIRYTKIGNKVFCELLFQNQTLPTYSGDLHFNLPFTSAGGAFEAVVGDLYWYPTSKWDTQSNFTGLTARIGAGQAVGKIGIKILDADRQQILGSGNSSTSGASGIYLRFSFTYTAA